MAYFLYAISWFWIKSHMVMLNQLSDIMWFLCGTQNGNDGNWFVFKNVSHLCAQHHHHSEHAIPFLFTFIYLPLFLFAFIDHSMFACHSRQVFLKLSDQTNMGCTGSSMHNHLCVITFSPRSCTIGINFKRNLVPMALMPSTISLPYPGPLIP